MITIQEQKHGEAIVDDELRSGRKSLCLELRHIYMCVADGRFFVGTPNGLSGLSAAQARGIEHYIAERGLPEPNVGAAGDSAA